MVLGQHIRLNFLCTFHGLAGEEIQVYTAHSQHTQTRENTIYDIHPPTYTHTHMQEIGTCTSMHTHLSNAVGKKLCRENLHGSLHHFCVLAHPHVVVGAPDSDGPSLVQGDGSVRKVFGSREWLSIASEDTKPPIGIVVELGLDFLTEELVIVNFPIGCERKEHKNDLTSSYHNNTTHQVEKSFPHNY